MNITLPYGHGTHSLRFPEGVSPGVLRAASLPPLASLATTLARLLHEPSGTVRLEEMRRPRLVAVAVPDETRPVPLATILPVLLGRVFEAWPDLPRADVLILVGGGLHEPADQARLSRIVPPGAACGCRVVAHDARHSFLADCGRTSRGTPVLVNALFAEADLRLVVGQIDPHQFVGFTGGTKGVAVGLAGAATIRASHSLLLQDHAAAGVLAGNPAREDISEAGRLVGVHLAVNVVLDEAKRPVWVGAGDPDTVLAEGAEVCARAHGVDLAEPYDLVVASCGGHPKDICLYQAQKGLAAAGSAVRRGGRVLLLAHCGEGVGDAAYHDYVRRFATREELMRDFRTEGFRMGAHKAYLFGRTLEHCEAVVHSSLPADVLRSCHLVPGDAQATLDAWLADAPQNARVAVIPAANATFFRFPDGNAQSRASSNT
ncbi:MAG: nickel-dependent lactate racemase [Desulfovibrionaceae bacterium]|jgi:nickel-dependent lactate racemase|nr:nickel-dependent lactate racemase [Desulfovibrionaceae bacterium]